MAFSFRHLPILGPKDTTANFEQLTGVIDQLEGEIEQLRNSANASPSGNEAWKLCSALGFKNSWEAFEAGARLPEYRKDRLGYVHLRGLLKGGTSSTTAFVLPVGYRLPAGTEELFQVSSGPSNDNGTVVIFSDGEVRPNNVAGEVKTWCYLTGVFFSTQ